MIFITLCNIHFLRYLNRFDMEIADEMQKYATKSEKNLDLVSKSLDKLNKIRTDFVFACWACATKLVKMQI